MCECSHDREDQQTDYFHFDLEEIMEACAHDKRKGLRVCRNQAEDVQSIEVPEALRKLEGVGTGAVVWKCVSNIPNKKG